MRLNPIDKGTLPWENNGTLDLNNKCTELHFRNAFSLCICAWSATNLSTPVMKFNWDSTSSSLTRNTDKTLKVTVNTTHAGEQKTCRCPPQWENVPQGIATIVILASFLEAKDKKKILVTMESQRTYTATTFSSVSQRTFQFFRFWHVAEHGVAVRGWFVFAKISRICGRHDITRYQTHIWQVIQQSEKVGWSNLRQ